MRKLLTFLVVVLMASSMNAANQLDLKLITSDAFAAQKINGINPIPGTDQYASISQDGKRIIKYAFRTGKKTAVLFDVSRTKGDTIGHFDSYILSPNAKKLLICTKTKRVYRRSYKAEFFIYDIKSGVLKKLSEGNSQQVPIWSPDNKHIAFVRDNNIFITDGDHEVQVTVDGKFNHIINGIPDWVNEEEFSFNTAMTWNADGSSLVWIKYDESRVKTYTLQLFKGMDPEKKEYADYPGTYTYKYPKAGQENAVVSLWSYCLAAKTMKKLSLPLAPDGYIPRVKCSADKDVVIAYTMNRHQDTLQLYRVNPFSGVCRHLLTESVPKYVKEEAMGAILIGKQTIVVPSDRDGFMHLYLYDMNGKLIRQVEKGKYEVTALYGYDESTGGVYYQADVLNPHDRQIYVALPDGDVHRLTDQDGVNSASFSGDFHYFINVWSDYNHPYVYTVRNSKGKVLRVLEDNKALLAKVKEYGWVKKDTFSFTTSEGVGLDGWMVRPAGFDPAKKYPVVMFQYSGPGAQEVMDSWSSGSMGQGGAFDMYLAQQGFIVVCVDGRGTGGRGADFEKCTYLKLGDLESKDQVETALYLGSLPYVDKSRIGIWGWSFGGFNTLMSMSEGRPVFKAGVAVAPPTNWKYYDTIYTERYMRTPEENPEGYAVNPIERVGKLHGALLICHGTADDNVHPQNTFEYAEALVQADKDFKENYYTNRNHSIYGGNTRNHLLRQIAEWFIEHLK
ncbi:MAG: S9 family peptidase [Prevotella sp.]|jgi:dipeptidyl-peptidase-4|nr:MULTISPECIES: S9 family peptidase [unclassified Prevotella]MCH3971014.1 S9 family peptidase [Prevotella sp.]MCH4185845.1 S9 family peptidase [Prevotella sp.]MCH4215717.1 S9 family peptidase [Prevotella sp.]MCH4250596.1 S9 family peptidase [Prevotella sp.]MCI1291672.1 S9 family peptidase [Prevotella sp.]